MKLLILTFLIFLSFLSNAQEKIKGSFEKDSLEIIYVLEEKIPKTIYLLEISICDLTYNLVGVYFGKVLPKNSSEYLFEGSSFQMKKTGEILTSPESFERFFIPLENLNECALKNYFFELGKDQRFLFNISGSWKNYRVHPPKKPEIYK